MLMTLVALSGSGSWRAIAGSIHIRSSINKLVHAFYEARSQALISGSEVVLCPSSTGQSCEAGGGWEQGWMVFHNSDEDHPPQPDADESILNIAGPTPGLRISANRSAFVMRPFGLRSTNGTLTLCSRNRATRPRALIVSYTGKPRTADASAMLCD